MGDERAWMMGPIPVKPLAPLRLGCLSTLCDRSDPNHFLTNCNKLVMAEGLSDLISLSSSLVHQIPLPRNSVTRASDNTSKSQYMGGRIFCILMGKKQPKQELQGSFPSRTDMRYCGSQRLKIHPQGVKSKGENSPTSHLTCAS